MFRFGRQTLFLFADVYKRRITPQNYDKSIFGFLQAEF
jgi:hypothetical protein